MRAQICIYCLLDRPSADRRRDHVMPRAFGSFTDSPTLACVCDKCNEHFGKTIERETGRDSLEAFLRLLHRTKPASEAHEVGRKRMRMSLEHENPAWKGSHLTWSEANGEAVASFLPQVGFRRRNGDGWIFVTEQDLVDPGKPIPPDAEWPPKSVRLVYGTSRENVARLKEALVRRGMPLDKIRETEESYPSAHQVGRVSLKGILDDTGFRCVSKIAFNYLAWRAGADFVRSESFDTIRAYVRHGTRGQSPLVHVDFGLMLAGDEPEARRTDGHMVAAAWTPDNRHLVGQVSLFNSLTYFVRLSSDFAGVWRPQMTGDLFNHRTGRITRLVNTWPR